MDAHPPPPEPGLAADVRSGPAPAALPAPLTSFEGREREMAVIRELLRDPHVRMLTLTGSGGVGKTRLSLQVARQVDTDFPGGVWFVPLAQVHEPALVPSAIATALSVPERDDGSLVDGIADLVRQAPALLILDNFEHVVGAAPIVTELLAASPTLACMVTSRVVLQLTGEHAFPVPPLALPPASQDITLESIARSPAVRLFVERGRAVDPGFALSDASARDIEAICRRLDGLPLAIELTAARLRHMALGDLAARLTGVTGALRVLTGGPRDAPARQRTIRDAIGWSYALLPAVEQAVLRQMAVFAGGFTREAAVAVAGSDLTELETEDAIAALVDHSLLRVGTGPASVSRYTMLETVREFGIEQMERHGEREDTEARHAAWCVEAVTWHWNHLNSEDLSMPVWLDWADAEQDNVRAALAWSLANGDAESAMWLAGGFHGFWDFRGLVREGVHWLDQVLAMPGEVLPMVRACALEGRGVMVGKQGDWQDAIDSLREAVEMSRSIDDHDGVARALYNLGIQHIDAGEYEAAIPILRESISGYRTLGNVWSAAFAQARLGSARYGQHRLDEATSLLHEAWKLAPEAYGPVARLRAPLFLGLVACEQRQPTEAGRWFREVLRFYEERDGLATAWVSDQDGGARTVASIAVLAGLVGQPERAARLLGAASRPRERIGLAFANPERTAFERLEIQTRVLLGDGAFDAARSAGYRLTPDEVSTEVEAVLLAASVDANPDRPAGAAALTERERDVLTLLAAGRTDREIGEMLFISHRTVSKHVGNILAKLGVASRAEAAVHAVRRELL